MKCVTSSQEMNKYIAYGLGIHSNIVLPEFIPLETKCDVTVHIKDCSLGYANPSEAREYLNVSPQETIIAIRQIGIFEIRRGCEIIVTPAPDADERLIQLCIAGSAIGILLYQRGFQLILHASAIDVNGAAVCFLGQSGAGKSSTAAALLSRGHKIISDDMVPITLCPTSATITPGYPQTKMSPEVATTLNLDPGALIFLPCLKEYAYRSVEKFTSHSIQLKRLYILTDSDEFNLEPLDFQASILELIANSYGMRSLQQALDRQSHLRQCVELLKHTTVYRLHRPRLLPGLPNIAKLVELDLMRDIETVA